MIGANTIIIENYRKEEKIGNIIEKIGVNTHIKISRSTGSNPVHLKFKIYLSR